MSDEEKFDDLRLPLWLIALGYLIRAYARVIGRVRKTRRYFRNDKAPTITIIVCGGFSAFISLWLSN